MAEFKLDPKSTHPLAEVIRAACGAEPGEEVTVVTPTFERPQSWPKPEEAPAGFAEFAALFKLTGPQLKKLGCGAWDGGLYLFPQEWYAQIPKGFPCEDITGDVEPFEPGVTDDDIRYGCLSFGVRIGPATDDEG